MSRKLGVIFEIIKIECNLTKIQIKLVQFALKLTLGHLDFSSTLDDWLLKTLIWSLKL